MKSKTSLIILLLITSCLSVFNPASTYAVTANPNPVKFVQPDGSIITIILKGDEFIHWAVTTDGYSLLSNKSGAYEYATISTDGNMGFSGIQANDPDNRGAKERDFLSGTAKGIFFSKSQIKDMKQSLKNGRSPSAPLAGVFPTTGTRKLLVILANFSNTTTTYPQANFDNYMNQVNYNGTGSFKDYYLEVSYGQLIINSTVTVWVTLPNTHDYYGPQSMWGQFAFDAVTAANNQTAVNYADFDNNIDGVVDGVAVFHQGLGQEESGSTSDIWSHSWDLTSAGFSSAQRTFDGVLVNSYTTMPERNSSGMGTIGVMCHEFGHNLGSPDFYDTDYATNGQYSGTGDWDLMAGGSWNGVSGNKPAHHNAYTKAYVYGWTSPVVMTTAQNKVLRNAVNYTDVVRYNTPTTNEYFLCENRQQLGFDAGIPGHGLIIFHVDGSYISTHSNANDINAGSHQGMYPVCANSTGNPPTTYGTINGTGCPFPGTGSKTSFTDATTPNSLSWAGANTGFPITNITEDNIAKQISFCFISCTSPDDPTNFTSTAAGPGQINLSWGYNTGNNDVLVAYNTTNTFGTPVAGTSYAAGNSVSGGGTVLYNGSNLSYNHTGLSPNTTYYYKAWSVLTGVAYSGGVTANATTLCGTVSTFPWNEGFENGGAIPACWTQEQVSSSGINWTFITGSGNSNPAVAHTGTYNACLKDVTTADNKTRLITPAINLSSIGSPQLTFWRTQAVWSGRQDQLSVYYKTSAAGTWTLLATYSSIITAWTQVTLSLPNPSSEYYINFEGNAKYGRGICIDDVAITGILSMPTVTTGTPASITTTTAASGGNVTSDGGASVTARGVCWSTSLNPVVTGNHTTDGSGTGIFISSITGLNPGTPYHVRAYATNSMGTAYGSDLQFTTSALPLPTLSVSPSNQNVTVSAGSTSFNVISNADWAVTSDQSWCAVTPSGTGNGLITADYTENTKFTDRVANVTVTVAGLTPVVVTVTQAAAAPPDFLLSAKNTVQTSANTLEFDVYLLDNDASSPFELASTQLGFLFNPGIFAGGSITASLVAGTSELPAAQIPTATPGIVYPITGYPGQCLLRLAGRVPPGAGSGYIISATGQGTRIIRIKLTSSVPFPTNSILNMVFTSSAAITPIYATRVAQYVGTVNTQLIVTPGYNAIVPDYPGPILNPPPTLSVAPSNSDVTSAAGNVSISVTSNAGWTATSNQGWCAVTPSGFGNGTISAVYGTNSTTIARVAEITVTVSGLEPVVVTVTQEGLSNKVINLNLLLQGLYNGNGTMHPASDELGAHWGPAIADKITIELHDNNNYTNVIYTLLNADLLTNGTITMTIPSVYNADYYITVKHRNSIETVSASPVSFSGNPVAYNFNLPVKAYGNNLGMMTDGWWVIYGGDVSQDGGVDTGDMSPVDNDSFNYMSGFLDSDTNGDGVIDTGDMTIVDNNAANYVSSLHP